MNEETRKRMREAAEESNTIDRGRRMDKLANGFFQAMGGRPPGEAPRMLASWIDAQKAFSERDLTHQQLAIYRRELARAIRDLAVYWHRQNPESYVMEGIIAAAARYLTTAPE